MKGVFVLGTDTGVGKTIVSAMLMAGTGRHTRYWKPVQSGTTEDDDTRTVAMLAELGPERVLDEGYRLPLPASPHHAARKAGQTIDVAHLMELRDQHDSPGRTWVVEGVGGLLVPLSDEVLLPELVRAFGLPVLVVSATRLGTINHTLLTVRQARAEDLDVRGIVLVGNEDEAGESGIAAHATVPILARVPRLDTIDPAAVRTHGEALLRVPRLAELFP